MDLIEGYRRWSTSGEFLDYVATSEGWSNTLEDLQKELTANPAGARKVLLDKANSYINDSPLGNTIFIYWNIYHHDLLKALEEVWDYLNISPPKLKIVMYGIMMHEWILDNIPEVDDADKAIIEALTPIFFGNQEKADEYLHTIRGMKDREITYYTKNLVANDTISNLSCNRDLWTILHNNGIYTAQESNWNKQLK